MKKWICPILIFLAVALLIIGYVDAYQTTLESLKEPGTMYCGFMPMGVLYDLIWMVKYRWHRIGSVVLILAGIVVRWLVNRAEADTENE